MTNQNNQAPERVADLLRAHAAGDESALDRLMPLVYEDLRRIAHRRLRSEPAGFTLDTTALVHETYIDLIDQTRVEWRSRAQFFAVAARLMRRILVDYVRHRNAQKRGGPDRVRVPLQEQMVREEPRFGSLLAIDEALRGLSEKDARMGQVVECRFFGGMTVAETAEALEVSTRTIERDWVKAKAYLRRALAREAAS